jgi:putative transposase
MDEVEVGEILAEGVKEAGLEGIVAGAGGSEEAAARRLAELVSPEAIDRMLADAEASGMPLDGADGLISQLTKAVIERALGAEMDDHLVKGVKTPLKPLT